MPFPSHLDSTSKVNNNYDRVPAVISPSYIHDTSLVAKMESNQQKFYGETSLADKDVTLHETDHC